jgi:hypothetical protein
MGANSAFHLSWPLRFCPHPGEGGRAGAGGGAKAAVSTKLGDITGSFICQLLA